MGLHLAHKLVTPGTPCGLNPHALCGEEALGEFWFGLFLFKSGYLLAVFLAVRSWPALDTEVFERVHQHWPRQGGPVFATHFATWDTAHYLYLSEVGYSAGVPSCAFYPLWPLLIRAFAVCTGGNHLDLRSDPREPFLAGGMVVVLFSGFVSVSGQELQRWPCCSCWSFPGSLFFQFPYSESLFFLLLMLLWLGLETDRPFVVLGSAFLLPMTRAIGVFCIVPIAWHFLWNQSLLTSAATGSQTGSESQSVHFDAPDGLGCLLHFNGCLDGKPLRGDASATLLGCAIHPQHRSIFPNSLSPIFSPTAFHEFAAPCWTGSFLPVAFTVPLVWKFGKDLFLWLLVLAFLPALSGDLVSFTRFALASGFPVFIALSRPGIFFEPRPTRCGMTVCPLIFTDLEAPCTWCCLAVCELPLGGIMKVNITFRCSTRKRSLTSSVHCLLDFLAGALPDLIARS